MRRPGSSTLAVRHRPVPLSDTDPLAPPITVASVHTFPDLDLLLEVAQGRREAGFYRRYGHGNGRLLEEHVRDLEGGEDALACASGMSTAFVLFWTSLGRGDHVVAAREIYGGVYSFLQKELVKLGVGVTFVPSDPESVGSALRPNTKIVYFETITNPLLRVPEARRIVEIAHRAGAQVVVDNTFATPILTRPLEWGADLVYHSGTKFLGGHADAVSGVLVGAADTIRRARKFAITVGAIVSPLDAWLTLRGLRTLALRIERASENALALARMLVRHPKVRRVHYPGLPGDPSHRSARRILRGGFGAMLSFELASLAAAKSFVRGCREVRLAPSLGDVSTTLSHPARSSHAYLSAAERAEVGVTDGLLRVSIGIEDVDDVLEDFRQALRKGRP